MKNNLFFKFIAVLLCAVSLMGAVGGVTGVIVLTSGDLYNRSVEEMVLEQVRENSDSFASWLAKNYAATELGGCSEEMVRNMHGSHYFSSSYDPACYGYRLLDAEGNELMSYNPQLQNAQDLYTSHTIPVTGQYAYLVSEESHSQIAAREAEERLESYAGEMVIDAAGNALPAEGAIIQHMLLIDENQNLLMEAHSNGSNCLVTRESENESETWGFDNRELGFLFYNPAGQLTFHSFFNYLTYASWFPQETVKEAYFTLGNGSSIRLIGEEPAGSVHLSDDGYVVFVSSDITVLPEEPAAETIPETTVPETTEATVPATTEAAVTEPEETEAAQATAVPETVAETIPSAASAVPETEETLIVVETMPEETAVPETAEAVAAALVPVLINGKPLEEYQINSGEYYNSEAGEWMETRYVYVPMPEMTVEVFLTENALRYASGYQALEWIRSVRNYLLPAIGICLLIFAVFGVYLCTAAGRKPKCEEVRAGGLNRLPLDVYLFGGAFAIACVVAVGGELVPVIWERDFWTGCGCVIAAAFACSLLFVGFCFAFVAQIKTPGGFWWRNTLCGQGIRLFMRFAIWLEEFLSHKGLPFLGRTLKKTWVLILRGMIWLYRITEKALLWTQGKCSRFFRWLWRGVHGFLRLLPVTWQWLLAGVVIILCVIWAFSVDNAFGIFLFLLIPVAIILYGAYCFGILSESTRRMGKGDLDTKVDDKLMVGCFKDSAADLNALADVAVVAAQKQLKSERMKTELITNVSHDIKTPLTSIINYVDLLQKPHTQEQEQQYLEVLDRQSQRLKKLIEDLMEMSKANTGNMQVDITRVDAVESVNQALGEFSDKLDRAQLIPVFRHKEDSLPMMADGRLVWRVLSNLLGNAVKYAMPGTRLYIDLMALEGKVVISLKNISREELNVDAEELMERFVRGDDSRNTEGSGLGLNIAKSLMELQKGQLQLLVDGDLFKVTLVFPGMEK